MEDEEDTIDTGDKKGTKRKTNDNQPDAKKKTAADVKSATAKTDAGDPPAAAAAAAAEQPSNKDKDDRPVAAAAAAAAAAAEDVPDATTRVIITDDAEQRAQRIAKLTAMQARLLDASLGGITTSTDVKEIPANDQRKALLAAMMALGVQIDPKFLAEISVPNMFTAFVHIKSLFEFCKTAFPVDEASLTVSAERLLNAYKRRALIAAGVLDLPPPARVDVKVGAVASLDYERNQRDERRKRLNAVVTSGADVDGIISDMIRIIAPQAAIAQLSPGAAFYAMRSVARFFSIPFLNMYGTDIIIKSDQQLVDLAEGAYSIAVSRKADFNERYNVMVNAETIKHGPKAGREVAETIAESHVNKILAQKLREVSKTDTTDSWSKYRLPPGDEGRVAHVRAFVNLAAVLRFIVSVEVANKWKLEELHWFYRGISELFATYARYKPVAQPSSVEDVLKLADSGVSEYRKRAAAIKPRIPDGGQLPSVLSDAKVKSELEVARVASDAAEFSVKPDETYSDAETLEAIDDSIVKMLQRINLLPGPVPVTIGLNEALTAPLKALANFEPALKELVSPIDTLLGNEILPVIVTESGDNIMPEILKRCGVIVYVTELNARAGGSGGSQLLPPPVNVPATPANRPSASAAAAAGVVPRSPLTPNATPVKTEAAVKREPNPSDIIAISPRPTRVMIPVNSPPASARRAVVDASPRGAPMDMTSSAPVSASAAAGRAPPPQAPRVARAAGSMDLSVSSSLSSASSASSNSSSVRIINTPARLPVSDPRQQPTSPAVAAPNPVPPVPVVNAGTQCRDKWRAHSVILSEVMLSLQKELRSYTSVLDSSAGHELRKLTASLNGAANLLGALSQQEVKFHDAPLFDEALESTNFDFRSGAVATDARAVRSVDEIRAEAAAISKSNLSLAKQDLSQRLRRNKQLFIRRSNELRDVIHQATVMRALVVESTKTLAEYDALAHDALALIHTADIGASPSAAAAAAASAGAVNDLSAAEVKDAIDKEEKETPLYPMFVTGGTLPRAIEDAVTRYRDGVSRMSSIYANRRGTLTRGEITLRGEILHARFSAIQNGLNIVALKAFTTPDQVSVLVSQIGTELRQIDGARAILAPQLPGDEYAELPITLSDAERKRIVVTLDSIKGAFGGVMESPLASSIGSEIVVAEDDIGTILRNDQKVEAFARTDRKAVDAVRDIYKSSESTLRELIKEREHDIRDLRSTSLSQRSEIKSLTVKNEECKKLIRTADSSVVRMAALMNTLLTKKPSSKSTGPPNTPQSGGGGAADTKHTMMTDDGSPAANSASATSATPPIRAQLEQEIRESAAIHEEVTRMFADVVSSVEVGSIKSTLDAIEAKATARIEAAKLESAAAKHRERIATEDAKRDSKSASDCKKELDVAVKKVKQAESRFLAVRAQIGFVLANLMSQDILSKLIANERKTVERERDVKQPPNLNRAADLGLVLPFSGYPNLSEARIEQAKWILAMHERLLSGAIELKDTDTMEDVIVRHHKNHEKWRVNAQNEFEKELTRAQTQLTGPLKELGRFQRQVERTLIGIGGGLPRVVRELITAALTRSQGWPVPSLGSASPAIELSARRFAQQYETELKAYPLRTAAGASQSDVLAQLFRDYGNVQQADQLEQSIKSRLVETPGAEFKDAVRAIRDTSVIVGDELHGIIVAIQDATTDAAMESTIALSYDDFSKLFSRGRATADGGFIVWPITSKSEFNDIKHMKSEVSQSEEEVKTLRHQMKVKESETKAKLAMAEQVREMDSELIRRLSDASMKLEPGLFVPQLAISKFDTLDTKSERVTAWLNTIVHAVNVHVRRADAKANQRARQNASGKGVPDSEPESSGMYTSIIRGIAPESPYENVYLFGKYVAGKMNYPISKIFNLRAVKQEGRADAYTEQLRQASTVMRYFENQRSAAASGDVKTAPASRPAAAAAAAAAAEIIAPPVDEDGWRTISDSMIDPRSFDGALASMTTPGAYAAMTEAWGRMTNPAVPESAIYASSSMLNVITSSSLWKLYANLVVCMMRSNEAQNPHGSFAPNYEARGSGNAKETHQIETQLFYHVQSLKPRRWQYDGETPDEAPDWQFEHFVIKAARPTKAAPYSAYSGSSFSYPFSP